MKLSAFFASLALASFMLVVSPVLAAVPADGPIAIERLDCTAADFTAADFAAAASPAAEQFTCDGALLAESGLCIVQVEPARVGFAFTQPPDPVFVAATGTCLGGRSPTG